jgi:hypothetical protein
MKGGIGWLVLAGMCLVAYVVFASITGVWW